MILLSARAGEESRVEGLGAGADDYLIKPFTARELLARVGAHLSMRKRREEAEQAVRESQSTLQSFYDSSPFLMGIAELEDDEVVCLYCNPGDRGIFRDRCANHVRNALEGPRRPRRGGADLDRTVSAQPGRRRRRAIRV